MNSEELELSLRTEFEKYLNDALAEMRQEVAELKGNVEAEFDRQKSKLDEIFENSLKRLEADKELDQGFKEAVTEHLRLAKDEGARITATAIAEAEAMEAKSLPSGSVAEIHDAVNEISGKPSQSEILKSLVHHAANFAPRGAFFIVKNEHLVGWRVFGKETGAGEESVREVYIPISSESIMCDAVRSLESAASTHFKADDKDVFEKLHFDAPSNMTAIPLVARGRGVAVLYADNHGGEYNAHALETLVRVAGMTVEILASNKGAAKKEAKKSAYAADDFGSPKADEPGTGFQPSSFAETQPSFNMPVVDSSSSFDSESFAAPVLKDESVATAVMEEAPVEAFTAPEQAAETMQFQESMPVVEADSYPTYDEADWSKPIGAPEADLSPQEFAQNFAKETDPSDFAQEYSFGAKEEVAPTQEFQFEQETAKEPASEYQFDDAGQKDFSTVGDFDFKAPQVEKSESFDFGSFETGSVAPAAEESKGAFDLEDFKADITSAEPAAVEALPPVASTPASKSRLDRNLDLPIEVPEDERRLHNDARRFARLLVSEIKLYNEQKVKEGREARDLYDRLREAIDRSREMYDKRVQPPVASKFDYFHYELVNTLAEADEGKLGSDYPGAAV